MFIDPTKATMDTRLESLPQTTVGAPPTRPSHILSDFSDYCEDLEERLHDLAERLVSMVDDEEDTEDSDEDDLSTEIANIINCAKNPRTNVDAERLLFAASYTQCMQEALRFLIQDEGLAQNDVMVVGLQRHLEEQKPTAVERAVTKAHHTNSVRTIRGPALM